MCDACTELTDIRAGDCHHDPVADDEQPPVEPATDEGPGAGRRRMGTVVKVILVTQLVMAILTGSAVAVAFHRFNGNIETLPGVPDEVDRPSEVAVDGPKKPLNILVIGSDTRDGEGNQIDGESGSDGSDVTLLLHISADRQDAYGVSLPRDAIVDRPDCVSEDGETLPGGEDVMFNTAYAVGGPSCTIQTVEDLTDVRVHHTVVVDFAGFKDMVDAVNGVEVCIPREVDDPKHNIFLEAGTQTLDGDESLSYVRERYVLSVTGDIGRMKRQQAFIASMINKVMSAETLTRPDRVVRFLNAATSSLQLDEGLNSIPELTDLVMQFQDTGLGNIRFITVPIEEYPLDRNRLQWTDDAELLWQRIRRDEPLGRAFSDGSISAAKPPTSESPTPTAEATTSPEQEQRRAEAAAAGLCT